MKKRLYIRPEMVEVNLTLEGIICESMPVGGRGDDFAAPEVRRHSAWDEYESQY